MVKCKSAHGLLVELSLSHVSQRREAMITWPELYWRSGCWANGQIDKWALLAIGKEQITKSGRLLAGNEQEADEFCSFHACSRDSRARGSRNTVGYRQTTEEEPFVSRT